MTSRLTRSAAATAGLLAGIVALAPAAAAAVPAASTPTGGAMATADEPTTTSSFTLPVLPDTQFYSRYSASQFYPQYGTNPFEVQTQWLVDHQDELDIPFVVHVGDVVDQEWVGGEWDAAVKAMNILTDGGLRYSVLPGNHDVADMGARSSVGNSWQYLQRFSASQMQAQGGDALLGTFQDGLSSAYLFEAEGHEWISLAIAWNASDDTFAWAQGILDAHPNTPVVLSSHAIINIAEDQVSPAYWWWGDHLWENLIRSNDQIIVTLNGHFHGSTMQQRTNDAGNPVYQILTDAQMAADGGNGIMTMLEFDLTNDRIDVETISPWVAVKNPEARASSDRPVLDGTWQSFSVDMDFGARFGWGDPAVADGPDLSELAKTLVSAGWVGDTAGGSVEAAGAREDYIRVPGTVAHWRFGGLAEGVVDENVEIPDVAGASPMRRSPIDATDAPDALEDVTITHDDVPFFSSDAGAICFDNVSRNAEGGERLAYVSTEFGAPATFADLDESSGYTIETFLKLDADWSEANNRWGAALTRGGARSWIGINDSADPGAGASWLGISSLREYQFSAGDSGSGNSYTLWSGEIMPSAWHHVAIVNDPAARTAIMYVDGVPVLRNASGVAGMMAADYMPWIIGTSTWNTEADHGWFGCVGETRIVDRALTADEFLTARADLDATGENFSVDDAPAGELPAGTEIAQLSGTGYPGAAVRLEVTDAVGAGAGILTAPTVGTVLGTATVAPDGTWSMSLTSPVTGAGAHLLNLVQSIGTRDGAPGSLVFSIAAPSEPGTGGGDPGDSSGGDTGGSSGGDSGSGSGSGSGGPGSDDPVDGALPRTGVEDSVWLTLAGSLILIGAGGAALYALRRSHLAEL